MIKIILYIVTLSLCFFLLSGFFWKGLLSPKKEVTPPLPSQAEYLSTLYNIDINTIDNTPLNFNSYKNNVILIVNVASKCGFTSQYKGLQALYDTYKDQGLIILGVPSNDFGGQEPGKEKDIKTFCQVNYSVNFPLTQKVHVKPKNQHPLYTFLTTSNPEYTGAVGWNFTKFLIDKNGKVVNRFSSMTKPKSKKITSAIEALLQE